jgi:hypothetical protein
VVLVALTALGACSGGDASGSRLPTTTAATVPAVVDRGEAVLVLDGVAHEFDVAGCEPPSNPAPGVTVDFSLAATGEDGSTLDVTRQKTEGAAVTTTETVTYIFVETILEAQRVSFADTVVDLREQDVTDALLAIDGGGVVRATGTFGPPGSTSTSTRLVHGDLVAACPA